MDVERSQSNAIKQPNQNNKLKAPEDETTYYEKLVMSMIDYVLRE